MHAWVRQIEGVNFYRRDNQLVPWDLIVRSRPPSVLLVLCYFSHFASKIRKIAFIPQLFRDFLGSFLGKS